MPKSKVKKGALIVAYDQLFKEKSERRLFIFLLVIFLVSTLGLLVFLTSKLIVTGYASYIGSRGGYITEVILEERWNTLLWHGTYGIALRVPGFTEQLSQNASAGEIVRQDLFFDCLQTDSDGKQKIFASTSQFISFDTLRVATTQEIDNFIGCNFSSEFDSLQCANNTFTERLIYPIGSINFTNVPSTHTYKYDGQNKVFDVGALYDGSNLVFVSHVLTVQRGYNPETLVNYQMLLPVPANSSARYYFFSDPRDTCPVGGIGENVLANLQGYVKDNYGVPIDNASVVVAGFSNYTDINGFYNLSFLVGIGTYDAIARKVKYSPNMSNLTVNMTSYDFYKNFTLEKVKAGDNISTIVEMSGYVFDDALNLLPQATVYLGDSSGVSNLLGYYSFNASIIPGLQAAIAVLEGYNNNYTVFNLSSRNTSITYNFTLKTSQNDYTFITGPYPTGPYTSPPGQKATGISFETAKKNGEDYWISTQGIVKEVRQNTFIDDIIGLYNFKTTPMRFSFTLSPELADIVKIDKTSAILNPDSLFNLGISFYGSKPIGIYNGSLMIDGDIKKTVPILVKIVEKKFSIETLLIKPDVSQKTVAPGGILNYKIFLQNLLRDQSYKVNLNISLKSENGTAYYSTVKDVEVSNSVSIVDLLKIPNNVSEGEYFLNIDAKYLDLFSSASVKFNVSKPIYLYSVFGVPLWLLLSLISAFAFIFLNFYLYRDYQSKKKRYRIAVDYNTLPRPGNRVVRLGNLAETRIPAYYELERLSTHAIVAGATGMGKSISAQVIVEETLANNIAVIVFDPTAQWSGMLRKCEDKRMLSFYSKFGLKESDARGFKGNVRQIKNSRELIEINKYINPGQIQIFSLNKLDPSEIDIFVANVIRQIFRSDPKESPDLKVLIVFDEVHRLLAKFGGSGEGFLQVERACREFRKWGIGVMLISQVLSDFVGEIKANINTELQARTLEESDLERIRTKYGEEFLKSLVKAEVGVVMFQNAEYNRGRPYFINFRPILHNTRRLSDEELEKYNKYNEIVDDLEFQILGLEKEKVDVFDLKMELKLVKDKLMTGSFSVVEIYLEGLGPRVAKEWSRIGKVPVKREVKLVDESEIKKSIEEAKKAREKFEADDAKKQKAEKKEENLPQQQTESK